MKRGILENPWNFGNQNRRSPIKCSCTSQQIISIRLIRTCMCLLHKARRRKIYANQRSTMTKLTPSLWTPSKGHVTKGIRKVDYVATWKCFRFVFKRRKMWRTPSHVICVVYIATLHLGCERHECTIFLRKMDK